MIILGITGSVGMGKTEASKYFLKNNVDVFDCDKVIASFYNKEETITEIRKHFPDSIYKNKIDKKSLANIVFNDKTKLRFLEKLLYKKLKVAQSFWVRKKIREKKRLLVFDVPLLLERDNLKKYDFVILLSCNQEIQKRRVLKRKDWNKERLEKTLKEQIPDYKKKTMVDMIIKTDRGKRYLYQEIMRTIKEVNSKKKRDIHNILKEF